MLDELQGTLFLDQDVPVQLAGMLRGHGLGVLTTLEAARLGAPDSDQLDFAADQGRAILTRNRVDFEDLHLERITAGVEHSGIIIAVRRFDLHVTRDKILQLFDRLDREQLRNGIFYV